MYMTDPPCRDCGHQGTAEGRETIDGAGLIGVDYDPPPADCPCECHAAWRMVHGRPAQSGGVAA